MGRQSIRQASAHKHLFLGSGPDYFAPVQVQAVAVVLLHVCTEVCGEDRESRKGTQAISGVISHPPENHGSLVFRYRLYDSTISLMPVFLNSRDNIIRSFVFTSLPGITYSEPSGLSEQNSSQWALHVE